ncbi:hypothetical protein E2R68_06225 [Psychromonas sp. RZ22]|uniref:hypothetical protein n=1 Tax=Psychromonas algarum TaxID=2555643 RepID=UPI0010689471|nr:hypothetical protein [Psychromonas sp. RZ22]TEW55341.1 hypothetical protein E2R68_06225 [Psychromonas sp. RZ22]
MKIIKTLPLLMFAFSLSSFATTPNSANAVAKNKSINKDNIYGYWHCKDEVIDPKTQIKVKVNYTVNFLNNGKSKGFGTALFTIPGMPVVTYKATDSSTWKLKGDQLTMSSTELTFVNVSNPELDQILNLKSFFPKKVNESAQILTLSKTSLKAKAKSNKQIYTCVKADGSKK